MTRPSIDKVDLGAFGVATLLGTGSSNYSGSSESRATNVEVGAARMNGTLVRPHGEFAFCHAIGVINQDNGFVKAAIPIEGLSGEVMGNGVCQVSTTVFRAAFLAGLPITEWWPHFYRIPFYERENWPPGLDASILQPSENPSTWEDFRFENPSDGWLLVESWADAVNVHVNIFGPDLGYRVEHDGPHFVRTMPGNHSDETKVSHHRRVYDRMEDIISERHFLTRYRAIEVGSDREAGLLVATFADQPKSYGHNRFRTHFRRLSSGSYKKCAVSIAQRVRQMSKMPTHQRDRDWR